MASGNLLSDPQRLAALHEANLLDTPSEETFDRFTKLASLLLECPVSLISLVDDDRQFFKSAVGLSQQMAAARQTPISHSFCQHVVIDASPLIVHDARVHPRVRENPAIKDYGVIAYLGMPLTTDDGHTLGSLCAIDTRPRDWSERAVKILKQLAEMVMTEIQLRSVGREWRQTFLELRGAEMDRDELVHMLVHDLRNPLGSMLVALDMMGMSGEPDLESLRLVQESGMRMMRMIGDILDANKAEAGKLHLRKEEVTPHELIQSAQEAVQFSAEINGIRLQIGGLQTLRPIAVDVEKFQRVLINLLANAVQHSRPQSTVVTTAQVEGEQIIFTVADQGYGIPAALQGRLFEKYSAVEVKKSGAPSSGLGLFFCRKVVEAHGGEISVVSSPEGTTFRMVLPCGKRARATRKVPGRSGSRIKTHGNS